jgi:hypothetical protein
LRERRIRKRKKYSGETNRKIYLYNGPISNWRTDIKLKVCGSVEHMLKYNAFYDTYKKKGFVYIYVYIYKQKITLISPLFVMYSVQSLLMKGRILRDFVTQYFYASVHYSEAFDLHT